jgi:hypothetical protein
MRVGLILIVVVTMLGAVACSSGGGSKSTAVVDDSEATASAATAAAATTPSDPNVLTAIVLQPGDVPDGLAQTSASFGNEYGEIISYSTRYGSDEFSISSSVGYAMAGATISDAVLRLRQAQSGLFRLEHNYTIDGADQAFSYGQPQIPAAATLVIKDGFYVSIVVQTKDKARAAEAQDPATLDRYTQVVFDRLKAYLADPSSVTPVPGTPRYSAPAAPTSAPD